MRGIYTLIVPCAISILCFSCSVKKTTPPDVTLQSSFNATKAVLSSGNAGIVFTGNEYWLSKWYADSIATLMPSGTVTSRFVVPGVTGIRAMTWDGTFIYAAVDTRTIYKINPVTKTKVDTIAIPYVTRLLSYDAAADGGAGGLWVGDDFGDLHLISLSGATLQTIREATHGLGTMAGAAFDSTTKGGGPFLWISDRGSTGAGANLVRIPVSTGVPDYTYNIRKDFRDSSLAAGACMSYSIAPGQKTLIVLLAASKASDPDMVARYTVSVGKPAKP